MSFLGAALWFVHFVTQSSMCWLDVEKPNRKPRGHHVVVQHFALKLIFFFSLLLSLSHFKVRIYMKFPPGLLSCLSVQHCRQFGDIFFLFFWTTQIFDIYHQIQLVMNAQHHSWTRAKSAFTYNPNLTENNHHSQKRISISIIYRIFCTFLGSLN